VGTPGIGETDMLVDVATGALDRDEGVVTRVPCRGTCVASADGGDRGNAMSGACPGDAAESTAVAVDVDGLSMLRESRSVRSCPLGLLGGSGSSSALLTRGAAITGVSAGLARGEELTAVGRVPPSAACPSLLMPSPAARSDGDPDTTTFER
jgi:hypothetical protein